MDGIGAYGPEPQPQPAEPRAVGAWEPTVTGFVFKVQANMDPKHRDRVAFVRLCSGHFQRGMKLHPRPHRQADGDHEPGAVPRRRTANWPRTPGPATSSASRTTASSASATR